MKQIDAANILGLEGDLTPEIIKKAYKKASHKYHPDKGGSNEMMKMVKEAYEVLKAFTGHLNGEESDINYGDEINAAINKIINLQGIVIEVCGSWVWVTGKTKQYKDALGINGAGFTWAKKKLAWYYRPKKCISRGRGKYTLDQIRELHGSEKVKSKTQKKLMA